jgi:hypothetical protein
VVRISKVGEIRSVSPKRRKPPAPKTGARKDNLPEGYKPHANAISGELSKTLFIPTIK